MNQSHTNQTTRPWWVAILPGLLMLVVAFTPSIATATDPTALDPAWCMPGWICLTDADLAEVVRQECNDYTACRSDLVKLEGEHDVLRGRFNEKQERVSALEIQNEGLRSQIAEERGWDKPLWLSAILVTAAAGLGASGGWCISECPPSTSFLLGAGSLTAAIFEILL